MICRAIVSVVLALVPLFEASLSFGAPEAPRELTVIALADFHGTLQPEIGHTADGNKVHRGGAANLASYVRILREKAKGAAVLVDGGDLLQGTIASGLSEGASVIRFYNHLGVHATALGNHEFDFGPEGPDPIVRKEGQNPRGALRARMAEAKFPILGANVVYGPSATEGKPGTRPDWVKPSTIVEVAGIRVGIIGAASEETGSTTVRANVEDLEFPDPRESVEAEARRLRAEEKVDVVVLTYHGGGGCSNNSRAAQDDLKGCKDMGVFKLVKALPEGLIDAVVAAHTHQGVAKRIGKTVILQPFSHGRFVAWASVPLPAKPAAPAAADSADVADVGGPAGAAKAAGATEATDTPRMDVRPSVSRLVPVCGDVVRKAKPKKGRNEFTCDPGAARKAKGPVLPALFQGVTVTPDTEALALLAKDLEQAKAIEEEPLGITAADRLTRSYSDESALGNLIADALRAAIPGGEIGLANGGGIREDLDKGEVSYGEVFAILPFDNRVAILEISGETILEIIRMSLKRAHGGLSWSGVSYQTQGCDILTTTINGEPINPQQTYRVVTNDYLAGGGSGFTEVKLPQDKIVVRWDEGYTVRDVVVRALRSRGTELRSLDFFDPANPRLRFAGRCGAK